MTESIFEKVFIQLKFKVKNVAIRPIVDCFFNLPWCRVKNLALKRMRENAHEMRIAKHLLLEQPLRIYSGTGLLFISKFASAITVLCSEFRLGPGLLNTGKAHHLFTVVSVY